MRVEALPVPEQPASARELKSVPENRQTRQPAHDVPAIADEGGLSGEGSSSLCLAVSSSISSQPDSAVATAAGTAGAGGSSDSDGAAGAKPGEERGRWWTRGARSAKQEAVDSSQSDREKDDASLPEPPPRPEAAEAGGGHSGKMQSVKARLRKQYTHQVSSLVNEHDINAALASRVRKKQTFSLKTGAEPGLGIGLEEERRDKEDDESEPASPGRTQSRVSWDEESPRPQQHKRQQQKRQSLQSGASQGSPPSSPRAGRRKSGFAGLVSAAASSAGAEKPGGAKASGSGAAASSPEPAWKVVNFVNMKGPPRPPWHRKAGAVSGGPAHGGAESRERASSSCSSMLGDSSASGGETVNDEPHSPREPVGERAGSGSARKSFLRGFILGKQPSEKPQQLALENGGDGDAAQRRGSITRRPDERDPHTVPIPYEVIDWSSQRDESRHSATNLANGPAGSMWETGGPPEQWLIIDFKRQVELNSMQLRCTGLHMDPKDIILYRCGAEDAPEGQASGARPHLLSNASSSSEAASGAPDGPWIIVRRVLVQAGPQSRGDKSVHNVPIDASCKARYWRIVVKESWGGNRRVRILAPLVFHGEPEGIQKTALQTMMAMEMNKQHSLTTMFSEVVNLSKEEREMRMIARKHRIPLDMAEKVCEEFRRYDTDQSGSLGYQQFVSIVRLVAGRRQSAASPMRPLDNIPESRIRHMWQNVDCDGSGRIELEEFLVWFHRTFQVNMTEAESSRHSERKADTVTEQYYASLGSQRLRYMTQRAKQGAIV